MRTDPLRVFLAGDVFGSVGLRAIQTLLPPFLASESVDFCVVNGENATAGIGVSDEDARAILAAGADAITGGNHSFEKRDLWPVLADNPAVLRPINFPEAPGRGATVFEKDGVRVAVLNLQGREDMFPLDCPFRAADAAVAAWEAEPEPPIILVDFHAESNQEKEALALSFAGRVAAVVGTHTHVQTADERVLPGGTAYITDLGMTGPLRSVIGVDPALAIKRNVTQVLYRMEMAQGPAALRGLLVEIDPATRRALSARRIEIVEKTS